MAHFEDSERLRDKLAQEAARLISDHGLRDYQQAKRKAAERLNLKHSGALPTKTEIESALREHQSLFGGEEHQKNLQQLREVALATMQMLEDFEPRLVGPVLAGTADENSNVLLHVFADCPEDIQFLLEELAMKFESFDRRVKARSDLIEVRPVYAFETKGRWVEATVLPFDGLRQAPISPVDGKPMRRAHIGKVAKLLQNP